MGYQNKYRIGMGSMNYLFLFGVLLLTGVLGGYLANKQNLPSVTGYILFGILLGPSVFNIITPDIIQSMGMINSYALGLIAINIGNELQYQKIKKLWGNVTKSFLAEGTIVVGLVFVVLFLLELEWYFSLLLGVLALTSSPIGIMAICKECKAEGNFTNTLIAHMTMDNIIGIVLFGFVTSVIRAINNAGVQMSPIIVVGEIFIAILVGSVIGLVITYLAPRIKNNEKLLVILIGSIGLGSGFAEYYDLSALLLNMAMGAVIVNLSPYKSTVFKTLNKIELPILVAFLTLAGAKIDIGILPEVGLIGIAYILTRSIGKILGGYIGGYLAGLDQNGRIGLGLSLTPQAGVAIGLSIIAEQKLQGDVGIVTTVILAGVVVFEIFGPLLVKKALVLNNEA